MKEAKASRAADYAREISIEAARDRAYDAIVGLAGLRGWWTTRVSGSDEPGGTIRLEFEGLDEHIVIRVVAADRPSQVEWRIVEHSSLDEWSETTIRFELSRRGADACTLTFRHVGLTPRLACFDDCEAGWDHFLGSLASYIEHGRGEPFGVRPRQAGKRRSGI